MPTCETCGSPKPLSMFYKNAALSDGHFPDCIDCHKTKYPYKFIDRSTPGHEGERIVIEHLRSMGVYAAPGKCSEWKWVDVVAWGCVRIEVKFSNPDARDIYRFSFQPRQRERGLQADLIVCVCNTPDGNLFYVFSVNDPLFYSKGKLRGQVEYRHWQDDDFSRHIGRWNMISEYVEQVSKSLLA